MSTALAIFNHEVKPGKTLYIAPADIKLTLVTLGDTIVEEARSSLRITELIDQESDDDPDDPKPEPFILANLTPGKLESQPVNLIIVDETKLQFENTGKNTLYLIGNYIAQNPVPFSTDSDTDSDSDPEDAYALDEISSDVEELMTDADRFEELIEENVAKKADASKSPKSAKKPAAAVSATPVKRSADAMDVDEPSTTPKDKKKKKQKTNKEGAAPASVTSTPAKPVSKAPAASTPKSAIKPVSKASGSAQEGEKKVKEGKKPAQDGSHEGKEGKEGKRQKKNKNKSKSDA